MVTGGFRTKAGMTAAVASGAVDVIGLARPIAHDPDFPRRLLDGTAHTSPAKPRTVGLKNVDGLLDSAWHQQQMARLGRGKEVRPRRLPVVALAIAVLVTIRDSLMAKLP
jgi:hypothetical protein